MQPLKSAHSSRVDIGPHSGLRIWILQAQEEHGSSGSGLSASSRAQASATGWQKEQLGCEGSLNGAETGSGFTEARPAFAVNCPRFGQA